MQQNERKSSRSRSPRGRSPSGRTSRWPCKDYLQRNLQQLILWKMAPSHGISGNVFANPRASSSAPYPKESNPWISDVSEHTSLHVMSESQTPAQDQRCQSGPSARNSFVVGEGGFWKNYGADQRLKISHLHFTTPATFACWKIRFKIEVCTCSQFPMEAMLWVKEVELVDSVSDLKSSCSVRGIQCQILKYSMRRLLLLHHWNRIVHNTQFQRKVSLEEEKAQKEDRFFRGRQIAYLIYEYFRVTGANDSVENNADLFTMKIEMMIFRNSIGNGTEFYYQWRTSHLMTYWKDCTNKEYESLRNSRP